MSQFGHERPTEASEAFKAGLLRMVLAGTVVLLVAWTSPAPSAAAYLAAGLALVFGVLLAAGKPALLAREPLARVVVDSALICLLVADTGGGGSWFFPLYLLAALGLVRIQSLTKIAAGVAAVLGAFLISAVASGGAEALVSAPVGLRATFILVFGVAAGAIGSEIGNLVGLRSEMSAALAARQNRAAKVEDLISGFEPTLKNSSLEEILRWTVETAHDVGGGTYAHVASLKGNHHRTMLEGDPDVCPSWWHPSIQRLLLQSCRDGETARSEEDVHGIENFLAVPVGPQSGEKWGGIVVGGGEFGPDEEHVLKLVSGVASSALQGIEEAPGGRDPVSGLPNRASLRHVLRRELQRGKPLTVLAADLGRVRHRDLLEGIGDKLGRQRAFRYGEDVFVVVLGGADEARARRAASALRQIVSEATAGRSAVTAGFALAGAEDVDPDAVLDAALGALDRAGDLPEGVAGATEAEIGGWIDGVVESMVGALEAKDPDIREHLEGVRRLAMRIGKEAALPEDQLRALSVGSLLHDIGKIGIPDRILHKPGRLTEDEYETMKRHPALGAEIIGMSSGLALALPIVKYHHERFDGRGYPEGLGGDEIPLLARIVSVADAFDSMFRDRPYGYGISPAAALKEIRDNSGTQFDPRIVELLVAMAEDIHHSHPDNQRTGSAG